MAALVCGHHPSASLGPPVHGGSEANAAIPLQMQPQSGGLRPSGPRLVASGEKGNAVAADEALARAMRMGLELGLTVQEIGYDADADDDLREAIAEVVGADIVDEDYDDVVDVVVMWWRDEDGDLVDGLVDAIGPLADHGVVWLLTPKPGRDGHIEAEDIADAAPTAGLQQTSTISAGSNWQGTRLVAPRAKR